MAQGEIQSAAAAKESRVASVETVTLPCPCRMRVATGSRPYKTKPSAALNRAGLDRRYARWRSHRAAGTGEWLRRGRTREWWRRGKGKLAVFPVSVSARPYKHGKRKWSSRARARKMHANFFRCARFTRIYAAIDIRRPNRASTGPSQHSAPVAVFFYWVGDAVRGVSFDCWRPNDQTSVWVICSYHPFRSPELRRQG